MIHTFTVNGVLITAVGTGAPVNDPRWTSLTAAARLQNTDTVCSRAVAE